MNALLQLAVTVMALFFLDAVWLNFICSDMEVWPAIYRYGNQPNWYFAQCYYALMATWIMFRFALPAVRDRDLAPALTGGAGLGFRISVLYAAVNQVFYTPWSLELIVYDIAWNTFAFAAVAVFSSYFGYWLEINYPENRKVQRT